MRGSLAAALIALALAAAPLAAVETPQYELTGDGTLVVAALPDVLSRPEVRPHLSTGLTTSFVISVTARAADGRKAKGAARIDVRWEPWDEVFHTATMTADGRGSRQTVPSFDKLVAWWRTQELPVAVKLGAGPWEVKVELSVVPFSQSEERDAQRWFSSAAGADGVEARPTGAGESRLNGVVDLLIATSIQRHSIVRYAWEAQPRRTGQP